MLAWRARLHRRGIVASTVQLGSGSHQLASLIEEMQTLPAFLQSKLGFMEFMSLNGHESAG
jgi:hypothetical protein